MKKKIFAIVGALSWISLGWMANGFFNKNDGANADANGTAAAETTQRNSAPAIDENGMVTLSPVTPDQAKGLLRLGAQNAATLGNITDERDLCAVVKGNIALTSAKQADDRFSESFQSCANRTLHLDAGFLQAGALMGPQNVTAMQAGDLCGVYQISQLRAAYKYALEAGHQIPDHDASMAKINESLTKCSESGEFAVPNDVWNRYVNQALILPFYQAKPAG